MHTRLFHVLMAATLLTVIGCGSSFDMPIDEETIGEEKNTLEHSPEARDDADWRGVQTDFGASRSSASKPAKGLQNYGLCLRVAWGPGRVNWGMSNPSGVGFSIKPESSDSLVRASGSGQDCDGIYRNSWGCGTAFKVPDSCTATVTSSGSISCCCNAVAAALGHTCQWVSPGSDDESNWPRCPL